MSRNSNGSYSLPGAAFVNGITADANAVNTKLSDIATEMTDSLSRSAKGGMLGKLQITDGSAAAPGLCFNDENALGFRRAATGDLRVTLNSSDLQTWTSSLVTVHKPLTISGALTASTTLAVTGATSMTGALSINAGTEDLALKPGEADHCYIGLYPRTEEPTTRGGYIGFAGAADTHLSIACEVADGPVRISCGTNSTAADPKNALELTNGNLKLNGAAPNSGEALSNTLAATSITKVRARVRLTAASTVVLDSGFNVTGVTIVSNAFVIEFASAFAGTTYQVTMGSNYLPAIVAQTTTTVSIQLFSPGSGTALDLSVGGSAGAFVSIECGGAQ